jgi:hypothetical protein
MNRTMTVGLLSLFVLCAAPTTGSAQVVVDPALNVRMTVPAGADWHAPLVARRARGPLLPSLYVGLIGLEAYDGYSTTRSIRVGASESNPVMRGLVGSPVGLWAAKGGAAFVSIYAAERLWRHNRRGQAIALMLASNGLMAAVARNNSTVNRMQR